MGQMTAYVCNICFVSVSSGRIVYVLSHSLHVERMIEGQIDYALTDTTTDWHGISVLVCLNALHA